MQYLPRLKRKLLTSLELAFFTFIIRYFYQHLDEMYLVLEDELTLHRRI